jgi:hypothetical protein
MGTYEGEADDGLKTSRHREERRRGGCMRSRSVRA